MWSQNWVKTKIEIGKVLHISHANFNVNWTMRRKVKNTKIGGGGGVNVRRAIDVDARFLISE